MFVRFIPYPCSFVSIRDLGRLNALHPRNGSGFEQEVTEATEDEKDLF